MKKVIDCDLIAVINDECDVVDTEDKVSIIINCITNCKFFEDAKGNIDVCRFDCGSGCQNKDAQAWVARRVVKLLQRKLKEYKNGK